MSPNNPRHLCSSCGGHWLEISWCRARDQLRLVCGCGHHWFIAPSASVVRKGRVATLATVNAGDQ